MTLILADRRALGALALVDAASGAPVDHPVSVTSPVLRLIRNRSGLYAIVDMVPQTAAERLLAAHLRSFQAAPQTPGTGSLSFTLDITDPSGRYLPRRVTLALPRGPEIATPVAVQMWRSPAAATGANWSGVRASLRRADGSPLHGAILTLTRLAGGAVLGRGLSDQRGEVTAPVIGLPVIDFSAPLDEGAPEPAALGTATTQAALAITAPANPVWPPDPDAPRVAWVPVAGVLPQPSLRTGRIETANLTLTLQPAP